MFYFFLGKTADLGFRSLPSKKHKTKKKKETKTKQIQSTLEQFVSGVFFFCFSTLFYLFWFPVKWSILRSTADHVRAELHHPAFSQSPWWHHVEQSTGRAPHTTWDFHHPIVMTVMDILWYILDQFPSVWFLRVILPDYNNLQLTMQYSCFFYRQSAGLVRMAPFLLAIKWIKSLKGLCLKIGYRYSWWLIILFNIVQQENVVHDGWLYLFNVPH